jgi:hypothetical protein
VKKSAYQIVLVITLLFFLFPSSLFATDKALEKRRSVAIKKFVAASRKSTGNYSTISLRNWRREIGLPTMSTEEMIRRVLDTFESQYRNLKVIDYRVVYIERPGPTKGIECDFLLIHHEIRRKRVYGPGGK